MALHDVSSQSHSPSDSNVASSSETAAVAGAAPAATAVVDVKSPLPIMSSVAGGPASLLERFECDWASGERVGAV